MADNTTGTTQKRSHRLSGALGLLGLFCLSAALGFLLSHHRGLSEAQSDWDKRPMVNLSPIGSTETLRIMPLVNWHAANPDLKTEMGVSYLVVTDDHRILLDLGQNTLNESPSPLLFNMEKLGINLADVDTLFISHNHFDHVGGKQWSKQATFSPGITQPALPDMNIYTPIAMTYPGQTPQITNTPQKLGEGIATTGTIRRQLFMGRIDEQAVVINVKDKGLVIMVGCGHQELDKLITRVDELFEEPVYGLVGDIHLPVPEGRLNIMGINAQRFFASGSGPWNPVSMEDVNANMGLLKSLDLGLLSIGGHDSSDQVLEQFAATFPDIYQPVKVGSWIEIAGTHSEPAKNSPQPKG